MDEASGVVENARCILKFLRLYAAVQIVTENKKPDTLVYQEKRTYIFSKIGEACNMVASPTVTQSRFSIRTKAIHGAATKRIFS